MDNDPFGRTRLPGNFDRPRRVQLLGEFAETLLRNEMPSLEARMFVAGGIDSWLRQGGDLITDYWKVRGAKGSTHTAPVIWKALREERQDAEGQSG